MGPHADELAQLALAGQEIREHLGLADFLSGEQFNQACVAADSAKIASLIQRVLQGEGIDLDLGLNQADQGLEYGPVGGMDEVFLGKLEGDL